MLLHVVGTQEVDIQYTAVRVHVPGTYYIIQTYFPTTNSNSSSSATAASFVCCCLLYAIYGSIDCICCYCWTLTAYNCSVVVVVWCWCLLWVRLCLLVLVLLLATLLVATVYCSLYVREYGVLLLVIHIRERLVAPC